MLEMEIVCIKLARRFEAGLLGEGTVCITYQDKHNTRQTRHPW
jgi:hypothetical protein